MGIHQDKEVYLKIKQLLDIPEDEPIFIIRAQDKFSVKIIRYYHNLVRDGVRKNSKSYFQSQSWLSNIRSITKEFLNWQHNNLNKVKVPD